MGRGVGLGHAMRCLNLATELSKHFQVVFLPHPSSEKLPAELARRCKKNHILCLDEAHSQPNTEYNAIEIFDGYQFEDGQFDQAVENGSMVVRIDDRPGKYASCNLLICHGPQANTQDFLVDDNCGRLLGPKYALIHSCFYERAVSPVDKIENLFISMGGGASDVILSKLASEALSVQPGLNIVAVRGFEPLSEERRLAGVEEGTVGAEICGPLDQVDLARKLAFADAAITAGGGMCLETASMGLPTFLVAISDNQIRPCEAMHEQGLAFYSRVIIDSPDEFKVESLRSPLTEFLENAALRKSINDHCRDFFNKSGIHLVTTEILSMVNSRGWPAGNTNYV